MPAVLSRLIIFFINDILRDLDNTKILLYKLFVLYLVVKPACVNAANVAIEFDHLTLTKPGAQPGFC